jgi:hypothetical protein
MPFASFEEFRARLVAETQSLTGKLPSSNKVPKWFPNEEGLSESWWRSTGRTDGISDKSLCRNRAYLRAYRAAGGDSFAATGITCGTGCYVWPDRSVIERSLRDDHLRFDPIAGIFQFTPAGLAFIE